MSAESPPQTRQRRFESRQQLKTISVVGIELAEDENMKTTTMFQVLFLSFSIGACVAGDDADDTTFSEANGTGYAPLEFSCKQLVATDNFALAEYGKEDLRRYDGPVGQPFAPPEGVTLRQGTSHQQYTLYSNSGNLKYVFTGTYGDKPTISAYYFESLNSHELHRDTDGDGKVNTVLDFYRPSYDQGDYDGWGIVLGCDNTDTRMDVLEYSPEGALVKRTIQQQGLAPFACSERAFEPLNGGHAAPGWECIGRQELGASLLPACELSDSDPDGDGYGFEYGQSCEVVGSDAPASEAAECIDEDGDGWGWDGTQSCEM